MSKWLERVQQNTFISILVETFQEWSEDKTAQIAGSLAYFAMLSLAPLLLITMTVLGIVTDQDTVEGTVYDQIETAVGTSGANLIQDMVRGVNQSQSGGIAAIVGIATLTYSAIGIFSQLQEALNRIWEVRLRDDQGILRTVKRRLWSAVMLPVSGLVILLALVVDTGLSAVIAIFGDEIPSEIYIYVLQGLSFLVSVVILTFLFAAIYKFLPDVHIDWEDVMTGAAVTSLLFGVGQFLLSYYLSQGSVSSTYGAAGTFIVVLLWVYYSAQIFLFGAEFTQVFARRHGKRIEPTDYARRAVLKSEPTQQDA